MKLARAENQLHSEIQSNPWIRHFRSSKQGRDSGSPFPREEDDDASMSKAVRRKGKQAVSCGGATTSRQSQDSVGSNIGSSYFLPFFFFYSFRLLFLKTVFNNSCLRAVFFVF